MVQSLSAPIKIDSDELSISDWLQYLSEEKLVKSMPLVKQAVVLAQLTGEHSVTPSGTTCLHQGLIMSEILADLNVDASTLCAGIISPCVLHADLNVDDVKEHLGDQVAALIEGMLELLAFQDLQVALTHPEHHPKVDNIRKMFLAMVSDVRVVLLKLAERVYMMHHLSGVSPAQCKREAKQTQAIYAPLANRLGVGDIKWQLEDLAFRYLQPKTYRGISKGLDQKRLERETFVWSFMSTIRTLMQQHGVQILDLTGRVKHIFSIYKKMQKKSIPIDEVYDTTAVRILVSTVEECYEALSVVHKQWSHVPEEFDDYIASPKKNGYQSIHTAVIVEQHRHIEVQIRTLAMHQQAEQGAAAHWVYKEGHVKKVDVVVDKMSWLREMMAWQRDMSVDNQTFSKTYTQLFSDRVYVFTPKDEAVDLPAGATVLDFAYYVHTNVGHQCKGGKVNGQMVPLSTALKTGDKVEVLRGNQSKPSRDWLNPHTGYLTTARAKAKVHHWFKLQDFDENVQHGRDMVQKEQRKLGFVKKDMTDVLAKLQCRDMDMLYESVGRGDIGIPALVSAMQNVFAPEVLVKHHRIVPSKLQRSASSSKAIPVSVRGVDQLLLRLASCCQPVPGEAIAGYITQRHGITVHRNDCANLRYFKCKHPERVLSLSWKDQVGDVFPVDVLVTISQSDEKTKLHLQQFVAKLSVKCMALDDKRHTATGMPVQWLLTLGVASLSQLSAVLTKISALPFVDDVCRV